MFLQSRCDQHCHEKIRVRFEIMAAISVLEARDQQRKEIQGRHGAVRKGYQGIHCQSPVSRRVRRRGTALRAENQSAVRHCACHGHACGLPLRVKPTSAHQRTLPLEFSRSNVALNRIIRSQPPGPIRSADTSTGHGNQRLKFASFAIERLAESR